MSKRSLLNEESTTDLLSKKFCGDNDSIRDRLMIAAFEAETCEFNKLFYQQERPLSIAQKVEGLELLGSSHILGGYFDKGFNCWHRATSMRSNPRTRLPEDDLAPISSRLLDQEWMELDDLFQMRPEAVWKWIGRVDPELTNEEKAKNQLNMVYQAMLVLRRYCKSESDLAVRALHAFILYNIIYNCSYGVNYLKYVLLLFEWDELYASHSIPICTDNDNPFKLTVLPLIRVLQIYGFKNVDDPEEIIIWMETIVVVFKWIATSFEIARVKECHQDEELTAKIYDFLISYGIRLVRNVSTKPLSGKHAFEFMKHLKRIVAVDGRTFCEGQNVFLFSCQQKYNFCGKTIEYLIEAGSDVNSVDSNGNTGLHYLIDHVNNEGFANVDPSLFHLVLKKGARTDIKNKDGICARNKIDGSNSFFWNMFFTLQAQCARVLRQEKIRINPNLIPTDIFEYVY